MPSDITFDVNKSNYDKKMCIEVKSGSGRNFFICHYSTDFRKHGFGCVEITNIFQSVQRLKIADTGSHILNLTKEGTIGN